MIPRSELRRLTTLRYANSRNFLALTIFCTAVLIALALNHETVSAQIANCFTTLIKPYVVPVGSQYQIKPLLSVGDRVPETGNTGRQYQMIGIPDGLGAYQRNDGTTVLWMNHELGQTVQSEPVIGAPLYRGAIVSEYILGADACIVSGKLAYNTIFDYDNPSQVVQRDVPTVANTTRGFARFCSGSLAFQEAGFDRPIYLAGEESGGSGTFDGKGGLEVAIFDNQLHTLPWLGRFPWENTLAQPQAGPKTVLMMMEDGPTTPDSQLTMWVGDKDYTPGASVLRRNGIDRTSGKFYAFRSTNLTMNNENTFTAGSITGEWVEIANVESFTDAQLEVALDAVNAFGFIRTEDGAFGKTNPNDFFFVTTGGSGANLLGRAYRLRLNAADPTGIATLEVIYNADTIVAGGGDTALSPDNVDTSGQYLMINEDGTATTRPVMAAKNRDGSVWRFDITLSSAAAIGASATRVAELDPPGRDGVAVGPGVWETSGVITTPWFGTDSWLMDVQAHPPTTAPATNTVEDGQLVLMQPALQPGELLLNEIVIAPPGTDSQTGCEYVEFRGVPNSATGNFIYADIEGDLEDNEGRLNYTRNLTGVVTGANGLIVIHSGGCAGRAFDPQSTQIIDPSFQNSAVVRNNSLKNNGSNSFLLLAGTTSLQQGGDADTNDDGVLDFGAGVTAFDGVTVRDGNNAGDRLYGLAGFELPRPAGMPSGEAVNAATRFSNKDARGASASSFYFGDLDTVPNTTQYTNKPSKRSANFPAGGALTPGAVNVP